MFCSDTWTISQGSPTVLSPHRTRRWLLFGSFTLVCVLLGSSILPLCPTSPFPNSGHYPEFPFIHLFSLLFPCTCNPGAFSLLYFPAYSFFLRKLTFLKLLALLLPSGQIFVLPWAAAASLGHSRGDRTVVNTGEQSPVCAALQTWGQHRSLCVSLIILTGVSSCFLTSWLLQSSPKTEMHCNLEGVHPTALPRGCRALLLLVSDSSHYPGWEPGVNWRPPWKQGKQMFGRLTLLIVNFRM